MTGPAYCRSSLSVSFSAGCAGAVGRWCWCFCCMPCSISKALWKPWRSSTLQSETCSGGRSQAVSGRSSGRTEDPVKSCDRAGGRGFAGFSRLARQPDDRLGKASNGGDRLGQRHRRARRLADDSRKNRQVTAEQRIKRRERMTDRAEIRACDQNERQLQRHHDVKDGALVVERHHDAADALNQKNLLPLLESRPAKGHDLVHVDAAVLEPRGRVRRHCGSKPPRRNALDIGQSHRKAQRLKQNSRIACCGTF